MARRKVKTSGKTGSLDSKAYARALKNTERAEKALDRRLGVKRKPRKF